MPYEPNEMYDYDHDFFNEPSEFEQKVDELKETLMDSVKDEHKQEIARLQKENGELRLVKSQLENMKLEHRQKLHELDLQKRDLERVVRKERLDTLMADFKLEMWVPEPNYKMGDKCDKCDDSRKVHYTTPLGREASEDCDCAKRITYFEPQSYVVFSFSTHNDGQELRVWYRRRFPDDDYYQSDNSYAPNAIYNGETFEEFRVKSANE
ncbi:hypothetical protein, partial [Paenibacillus terrae]|uniref:hypothetical protein n=1 Tax=Paenibacillus terrae TaxID=159743 RepID=UPI001BAFFF55